MQMIILITLCAIGLSERLMEAILGQEAIIKVKLFGASSKFLYTQDS